MQFGLVLVQKHCGDLLLCEGIEFLIELRGKLMIDVVSAFMLRYIDEGVFENDVFKKFGWYLLRVVESLELTL